MNLIRAILKGLAFLCVFALVMMCVNTLLEKLGQRTPLADDEEAEEHDR